MDIETSKRHIKADGYIIDENTIEVLDEEQCIWLAYVAVYHTPDRTFPLIVRAFNYVPLTSTALYNLVSKEK